MTSKTINSGTIKEQILRFWESDKIVLKYEENIKNLTKKAKLADKKVIQAVQNNIPFSKIKILQEKRKSADLHLKNMIHKKDRYVDMKINKIRSKTKKSKTAKPSKSKIRVIGTYTTNRMINGELRKVEITKLNNGKEKIRMIVDRRRKRKIKRTVSYIDAKIHFKEKSIRSKLLDKSKKSKKVFKKHEIPIDYIKKGGTQKYDVEDLDVPDKKEKLPVGIHKRKKIKIVGKQPVHTSSYYDTGLIYHTTSLSSFKRIAKEKILKPQYVHGEGNLISFSIDKRFTHTGAIKLVFIRRKIKTKLVPIAYYDPLIYENFMEKHKQSDPILKEKKSLYSKFYKHEREWQTKKPVKITKLNLKQVIFLTDKYYGGKSNMDQEIKTVRKLTHQLGAEFRVRKKW